jgi:hypothetical protein
MSCCTFDLLSAMQTPPHPSSLRLAGATVAILYGPPGTECFERMSGVIRAAADRAAGPVVYAHRPLLTDACRATEVGLCWQGKTMALAWSHVCFWRLKNCRQPLSLTFARSGGGPHESYMCLGNQGG